jgi:hypothetical protein
MRNIWFIAISLTACAHAACGGGGQHSLPDAPPPDAEAPPDAQEPGIAPRLISPLSMTIVTQQQPRLRWVSGAAGETVVVELCKDRACTVSLPVATQLAGDMQSAVPAAPLPAGWVFWRVSLAGTPQVRSATWQFWVGPASASTPVDTSNGALLDVNGDGYPDLLVGASGTGSGAGVAHLYLGSASSMTDWSQASPAMRIDLINPQGGGAAFGFSVASAGDVNGDGYADFLIGANSAGAGAGLAYLYLGSATPSAAAWNATASTQRFDLIGPDGASAYFGSPVVSVGDVNGDGYADFLIGAYRANAGAGAAHLYLGSALPRVADWNAASSPQRIDLSDPDGATAYFGDSLASAGDVNGDGYPDFLVGAYNAGASAGAAHLYLGSASPTTAGWNGSSSATRIDLATPDGALGNFGFSVTSAGDVNGDGYADFLIGAFNSAARDGAAHLYLGSTAPDATGWNGPAASQRIDLTSPDDPSSFFGFAVATAGDVNGDGYADFLIGAEYASSGSGTAHLYLGAATPLATAWNGALASQRIDLTSPDGSNGLFGASMASTGDVNGDGYTDFVVGANNAGAGAGTAHLYLGAATPSAAAWNGAQPAMRVDLTSPDGTGGLFGYSVASVDDDTASCPARQRFASGAAGLAAVPPHGG